MLYSYLFVFMISILDTVIAMFFTIDYSLLTALFVPEMTTMAMMLSSKSMSLFDSFKFAIVCGLIVGLFYPDTIWSYVISYCIVIVISKIWSLNLSDSFIELVILCILTVFINQLVIYLINYFQGKTTIGFVYWVYKILLKTIIFNCPLSCLVVLLNKIKDSIVKEIDKNKQSNEKVFWGD